MAVNRRPRHRRDRRAFEAARLDRRPGEQRARFVHGALDHRLGPARQPGEGVARRAGGIVVAKPAEQARQEARLAFEIGRPHRGGIEPRPPRRVGDGVVQRAEAIDQAQLPGRAAVPDPALGDLVDPRRRQPPRPRDQADEAAIDILDPGLQQPLGLGRRAAQQIGLARKRRGPDSVGADAEPLQRPFEARQ